ncbi:MAG TPA: hypothetical protein VNO30_35435 [Kofleriaceae bacterium]|nr:hypothetical protein [Kofleriaceae bacterium]
MRIALSIAAGLGAALAAAPAARAEPGKPIATCGASQLELVTPKGGDTAEVRGQLVTPKGKWGFAAKVGLTRVGKRTRTIAVEEPRADGGGASPYATQPSQVWLDLFVDEKEKKLTARHASEGAPDPEIALTLTGCQLGEGVDGMLAALAEPPPEPAGCDAAILKKTYAPRVAPLKLAAADAEREARALCEDHQKTLAARARLEQRLADQAAQQRAAARGKALLRVEEARTKAWEGVDACVAKAAPADPPTAAKLRAAEEKLRACYDRVAPSK